MAKGGKLSPVTRRRISVVLVARRLMARTKRGRPKAEEGESGTGHVRVFEDIRDMLSDITLVRTDLTTAQILDPLVRAEVTQLWEKHRVQIDAAKAAQRAADESLEKARQDAARVAEEKAGARKPRTGS